METLNEITSSQLSAHDDKIVKAHIIHPSFKTRLWLNTSLIALAIYAGMALLTFWNDQSLAPLTFSKALGGTAALCFAISFSFSAWCYYFDFLDRHLIYRKYFGLVGYFIALLYSFSLLFINPQRYFFGFFQNFFSADFILGITAMAYFTLMALISNPKAITILTPKIWKWILRGGFVAWFLLAIRAYVLEKILWLNWFSTRHGFPPPRLLLSLLVISVILFRLSVEVSKFYKHKKPATLSPA